MVYLRIRENTARARAMLTLLKTMPFVEVVEKEKEPNAKTLRAMQEAEKGGLKKHRTLNSLLKELNA